MNEKESRKSRFLVVCDNSYVQYFIIFGSVAEF